MVCTVAGYVASFIVGIIFNYEYDFIVEGVLQDRLHTAWQIWTGAYLVLILAGIIWKIFNNRAKSRKF